MDVLFSLAYGSCYWVFVPRITIDTLGGGPEGYAFTVAAFGLGGLLGGFIGTAVPIHNKLWTVAGGFTVAGLGFGFIAVAPNILVVALIAAIIGASMAVENVAILSILHEFGPSDQLGRVYSSWRLGVEASGSVGILVAGYVVDAIGPIWPTFAMAAYVVFAIGGCIIGMRKAEPIALK